MAITLPKKIFGRTVEGGIERALAKAAEEAESRANTNSPQQPIPEPAPLQTQGSPHMPISLGRVQIPLVIDWSKFLDPDREYKTKLISLYGRRKFVDLLWKRSKDKQNRITMDDIANLLTEYKACDPSNVYYHAGFFTGNGDNLPGPRYGLLPFARSKSIRFEAISKPGQTVTEYLIKRDGL
jgi:hypothetical protein